MNLPRVVTLFQLTLLPLCSAVAQQTSAPPQATPPGSWSKSGYVVAFGPTQSNLEGKAAVARCLQALGGPAKINSVKSLRQMVSAVQQGVRIEIDQSIVYPDQQSQRLTMPEGKRMTLVVTPHDAFMILSGQVQELPSAQRTSLDCALKHDPVNVLQHIDDPKYIFTATGQEKVDSVDATVVDVEADGVPTRWWIAADGKLLRERAAGEGGKIQTMVYSAWKNFDGLQYPTKYEMFSEGGFPVLSMTLNAMQVNVPVSPKLFQRPAGN
jgi:hypothetical protein